MNLEQQLKMSAESWLGEEVLSPAESARLTALVRRRSQRSSLKRWGAVAAGLLLVGTSGLYGPALASIASDLPWVGRFIQQMAGSDEGLVWAEGQGYVMPVGKSMTKEGITFRIDSILADGARTELFWSVDGFDPAGEVSIGGLEYYYNKATRPGGWSSSYRIQDGRLLGTLSLPPLPHSVTQVGVTVAEINGVKGDWALTFSASRQALDPQTRVITINQPIRGEGYELMVTQVTLTPTGTVVEVTGESDPGFAIREVALGAKLQSLRSSGSADFEGGRQQLSYRFQFDRLDPVPERLSFRLLEITQVREGGPVLPVQPGARVEWQGATFTLDSIQMVEGRTEVRLRVDGAPKSLLDGLHKWSLRTKSGEAIRSVHLGAGELFRIDFPGQITDGIEIEALQHAESLPLPASVEIDLK